MTSFERMIVQQYPYAIPGEDFTVKTGEDGNPVIDYWNKEKLGYKPSIVQLHTAYMQWAKLKKEMLPTFDDSDPAPWLNEEDDSTITPLVLNVSNSTSTVPAEKWITYPNGVRARIIKKEEE